ncbi:MAG: hypothetical protein RBU37_06760 [Myxococcota bacterium]|jgi:uncharacterized protein YkwD|nr:hypothetical protein [Myxococcota bacterium]
MRSNRTVVWAALLAAVVLLPRVAQAYGEPVNGFPSWYERVILVFTNEARSDPQAALDGCALSVCEEKACYDTALPPLQWHEGLAKLARFHAQNLVQTNCGMSSGS